MRAMLSPARAPDSARTSPVLGGPGPAASEVNEKATLLALCTGLTRTALARDRSWARLTAGGELWRGCRHALGSPAGTAALARCYHILAGPDWARAARAAHALPEEASQVQQAAARIVAVAVVASLARFRRGEPGLGERLCRWARRAGLRGVRVPMWPAGTDEAEVVRQTFAGTGRGWTATAAAALDAALDLLNSRPPPTGRILLPILLARGDEGRAVRLWLVRQAGSPGAFFRPLSTALLPVGTEVDRALRRAWLRVQARLGPAPGQVRWWLQDIPRGPGVRIAGPSLQAAAEVGLTLLLRGQGYDGTCAITATVPMADGRLGPVAGVAGAAPKLSAARALRPAGGHATVVVCPDDLPPEPERLRWLAEGVAVVAAADVHETCTLAQTHSLMSRPSFSRMGRASGV